MGPLPPRSVEREVGSPDAHKDGSIRPYIMLSRLSCKPASLGKRGACDARFASARWLAGNTAGRPRCWHEGAANDRKQYCDFSQICPPDLTMPKATMRERPPQPILTAQTYSTSCWPERRTTTRCAPMPGSSRTPRRSGSIARRRDSLEQMPRRSSEPSDASRVGVDQSLLTAIRSAEPMAVVCVHHNREDRRSTCNGLFGFI